MRLLRKIAFLVMGTLTILNMVGTVNAGFYGRVGGALQREFGVRRPAVEVPSFIVKGAAVATPVTVVSGPATDALAPGSGVLWGTNSGNDVWVRMGISPQNPKGSGWSRVPGKCRHVAVSPDGLSVWALADQDYQGGAERKHFAIFFRVGVTSGNPTGTAWEQVTGGLAQISVGQDGHVWGVNGDGQIYYRLDVTPANRKGTGWRNVDGRLKHVSIGPDGQVWGVNSADNIYFRDGVAPAVLGGTGWSQIPGGLKQISVGPGGACWGVNSSDNIWARTGVTSANPKGADWKQIPGGLKYVSMNPSGQVWGANAGDQVWFRNNVTTQSLGTDWEGIDLASARLKQLEAGPVTLGAGIAGQIVAGIAEVQSVAGLKFDDKVAFEIVSARYGIDNSWDDVTGKVRSDFKSKGYIDIPGDMNNFFGHDPKLGFRKKVEVNIRENGVIKTITSKERVPLVYRLTSSVDGPKGNDKVAIFSLKSGKYLQVADGKFLKATGNSPQEPGCTFIVLKNGDKFGFKSPNAGNNNLQSEPGSFAVRFENQNFLEWEYWLLEQEGPGVVYLKNAATKGYLSVRDAGESWSQGGKVWTRNHTGGPSSKGPYEKFKIEIVPAGMAVAGPVGGIAAGIAVGLAAAETKAAAERAAAEAKAAAERAEAEKVSAVKLAAEQAATAARLAAEKAAAEAKAVAEKEEAEKVAAEAIGFKANTHVAIYSHKAKKYLQIVDGKFLKPTGKYSDDPGCTFIVLRKGNKFGFKSPDAGNNNLQSEPGSYAVRFENKNFLEWEYWLLEQESPSVAYLKNVETKGYLSARDVGEEWSQGGKAWTRDQTGGPAQKGPYEKFKIEIVSAKKEAINLPAGWTTMAGEPYQLAAGSDADGYLLGLMLEKDGEVQKWNPNSETDHPWELFNTEQSTGKSVGDIINIAASDLNEIFVLTIDGQVWKCDNATKFFVKHGLVHAGLDKIAAGKDLWACDSKAKKIYRLDVTKNTWQEMKDQNDTGGIEVSTSLDGTVYKITENHIVRVMTSETNWEKIKKDNGDDLLANNIAVSKKGYALATYDRSDNDVNELYEIVNNVAKQMLGKDGEPATGPEEIAVNSVGSGLASDDNGMRVWRFGYKGYIKPPAPAMPGKPVIAAKPAPAAPKQEVLAKKGQLKKITPAQKQAKKQIKKGKTAKLLKKKTTKKQAAKKAPKKVAKKIDSKKIAKKGTPKKATTPVTPKKKATPKMKSLEGNVFAGLAALAGNNEDLFMKELAKLHAEHPSDKATLTEYQTMLMQMKDKVREADHKKEIGKYYDEISGILMKAK